MGPPPSAASREYRRGLDPDRALHPDVHRHGPGNPGLIHVHRYGAQVFRGRARRKTVILELGPVLTALALAGRVGASIASELGTMRVTEQIDALEALAYDPVAYLVVPRVLAGMFMFPVITVFSLVVGVAAGWITSLAMLDITTPEFVKGLKLFFDTYDVQFALIKAWSFGLVVTGVGCFYGFQTSGGAEGVGHATTRAVVVGSMIILVLDAFWAAVLL